MIRPRHGSALALVIVAGCGRVGFGDHGDAAADSARSSTDATTIDGNPKCINGDGICLFGCAGTDDDCATTCGDGRCVGNAGELCENCPADCATQNPVCGNGACDPGEAAAGCYADCGPMPWPWTAEELDLLAQINTVRANGYACPDGAKPPTTPLALGAFTDAAREWAWELGHQEFFMAGGTVCNGRTLSQRSMGFTLYNGAIDSTGNYPTVAAIMADWLSITGDCDALMQPAFTSASPAVVHDARDAYVLLVKQ